ncbi:Crp/Fnr family transcriptional regulator [Anaerotignum sp.]|uniref:Crp/Fnr family transcriptional regulator n=1 Tax=Anaerotignum sp. TaxID=2039241 RepID=UPI002714F5B8|nr:Crp/Fnr family transcriptional regulator [Anaerotignum sp.]
MDDIIEVLYKCIIFRGLDKAQIRLVLSRTRYHIKEYGKNEFICREDQFSKNVGIIILGSIEIQKLLASGNLICIFHKNKGDLFGGAVVFSTETTYPCDVFSRTNSKILFFPKQSIFEMCKEALIAENILNAFANRIIYYEKRLELFSYSSIKTKIAYFLIHEIKTADNSIIHLSFTKKTWAEYLNVSRPSLYRELKKLCNDNIIEINKDKIIILDENALIDLLQK